MGAENRLSRLIGNVTGKNREEKAFKEIEVRKAEFSQTYRFNYLRFDEVSARLNAKRLSNETRAEIGIAVRTARALQKDEDSAFFREAMLTSGISLETVIRVNDLKDKLELEDQTAYNGEPE